jgi:hypothetical protein
MRINNKQQINKIISCLCIMLFSVLHLGSQNNNEPLFTFGIVADVQYADRDNSGMFISPQKYTSISIQKYTILI